MIHGLRRCAKWLNWLGRRLHFATLSCFVFSGYNRSALNPQTNIETKNYLNTKRWLKTFWVCLCSLNWKYLPLQGKVVPPKRLAFQPVQVKGELVLKLLVMIMFNWLNAVVYVRGGSGAALFNPQVFSFTSSHWVFLSPNIDSIYNCFGELFSCFFFVLRFIFSIYLFAPPLSSPCHFGELLCSTYFHPFLPFHSNIAPFHIGIIVNIVMWSRFHDFVEFWMLSGLVWWNDKVCSPCLSTSSNK